MSRHTNFQFRGEREGRVAQMNRQEEVIARKRQEILEKQKTNELAKQVAAAQCESTPTQVQTQTKIEVATVSTTKDAKPLLNLTKQTLETEPIPPKNNFTNDGSFFENFRKITEAAKKAEEEKQQIETDRLAKEQENKKAIENNEILEQKHEPILVPHSVPPPLHSAFSTNSMSLSAMPVKEPIIFNQNIPPFLNLAAPPPPPPPADFDANPIPRPFDSSITPEIPQFEGNDYQNEIQMNRDCGNIEQMEHNIINPQPSNSRHSDQSNVSTNVAAIKSTIPTTIDGLIEFIAKNGDNCETKIIDEIAQMNERSLFRFLNDKDSENYKIYREKVLNYRAIHLNQKPPVNSNEKYDPEDILRDDENEIEIVPPPRVRIPSLSNHSDDYDSDSGYMQETMERNLKNMKRRIDSGGAKKRFAEENAYSSDDVDHTDEEDHMEMYRKIQMRENALNELEEIPSNEMQQEMNSDRKESNLGNRKKRSRWGEKTESKDEQQTPMPSISNQHVPKNKPQPMLSTVTRTDPALLNYARQNYGTTNLSEEDWKNCEEHYKVNLLYQDMLRKREEIDRLAKSGKNKYEYDSDEDITGGTWEHKVRTAEMEATAAWADALNQQSQGKHHIGDFLPPEELKKFMEIYKSKQTNREPDLSDYKEYKLKEDNKGFQMLQKLGWTEGQGLGVDGGGILTPVNKATQRDSNQGLGTASNTFPEAGDNEYDAYRKRMMLAYRFRPNPLNNPRRAYY